MRKPKKPAPQIYTAEEIARGVELILLLAKIDARNKAAAAERGRKPS